MDELFEALTLIQTKRIKSFPVILFNSDYWRGLVEWLKDRVLKEKAISEPDLEIFHVVDTPEEAVSIIRRTVVV